MGSLSDVLFAATALTYVIASGVYLAFLAGSTKGTSASKLGPWLLGVGVALHATHIVVSSLVLHVCPVEGVHFGLSVLSLCACAAFLGVRIRYRVDAVGAFVAPLALTFLVASRFVAATSDASASMGSAILPLHVTVNLLGDALFTLAFGAAVAYLLQERQLKNKHFTGLFQRLPPLDALDNAEHKFLLAGFPLLTIGILTGTIWARRVELGGPADVARAIFGYATWLLIAGVLLMRAAAGWRGRRAAYGTIAGFGLSVIVLLIYLLRGTPSQVASLDTMSGRDQARSLSVVAHK
ncbi:MAG: cytochrome C assembly family protein [Polyangiaceae bacterium]